MEGTVEVLEAPEGASRQVLAPETEALFAEARRALDENRVAEATTKLRAAREQAPEHAQVRSFLGLAVARGEGDFAEARELCEDAARQEFFNPELYLNLAKVYLRFDRRPEALRYLRRGEMIDPGHVGIREAIASLGRRRLPIVPFLPRRHPVNRMLGSARNALTGAFARGGPPA